MNTEATGDSGAVSMSFENFSGTVNRDVYGHSKYCKKIVQSPGPYCSQETGLQTLSTDNFLTWIETGDFDIWCTWIIPETGYRFGVKIHVPYQEWGFGTAPYWYVMSDKSQGTNPSWVKVRSSEPYYWSSNIGRSIKAVPTSSHSSLDVASVINPDTSSIEVPPAVTPLVIDFNGQNWIAAVQGTGISYTFTGATPAAQAANVQALANAMQGGAGQVTANVRQIFSDVPANQQDWLVTENLFGMSEELYYGPNLVYLCVVDDALDGEIVDAGIALLAVL